MPDRAPVVLAGGDRGVVLEVAEEARGMRSVGEALELAARLGRSLPTPGRGGTATLWSALATLAAEDLAVARVIEPHLDAAAIFAEIGRPQPGGSWGVYAAERPGTSLDAEERDFDVHLNGVKPWCSLADRLDSALVTAHFDGGRRLFAVDLLDPGVSVAMDEWHALGLATITSGSVTFRDVPAEPMGAAGWYLERPGFAWGGIGVAACWFGGATAVARSLLDAAGRREPDQLALAAIGRTDRLLHAARISLETASAAVDAGSARGAAGALLAARVRGVVAEAAETVLAIVGHALGPAPLTLDADHARRVADLTVYLRQHHAERDDASLGRAVLGTERTGW